MVDLLDWTGLASPKEAQEAPNPEEIEEETLPADPRSGDGWPTCEVCGDAIDWTGRGRRPKKCAEHRRRTISTNSGPTTRKLSSAESARLARIELALAKQGIKFGAVTSKMLPVTGVTIVRRSENAAAAIVKICADKPQYLEVLEKVAAFEAVMDVAEFLAAIVVAVGVDMGQVNPEGVVSRLLEVDRAYYEVEGIDPSVEPAPQEVYQPPSQSNGSGPRAPMFGPGLLPGFTPIGADS